MVITEALSFLGLAYITFQSVLEVVIVSFAGFWCTYSGLLPKEGQKIISRLNVDVFTPCLIFSKLAKSLSIAKILEIGIIPVFYAISTGISFVSGKALAMLLHLDVDETNFVVANSIFGNSNSLPVSLTLSLAYTLPGLEWDQIPNDTKDSIASRGILYLLIWQQIGQVLRWTWGYNKLMRWSGERDNEVRQSLLEAQSEDAVTLAEAESELAIRSPTDFDENSTSAPSITSIDRLKTTVLHGVNRVRGFMNPPLYAMVLSVIVASIHPLQHELFHADGFINNTLSEAVNELGALSIPLILVVLGSNLYPSHDVSPKSHNYKKIVFASIVGRMIFPSLLLLPLIAACVKFINVSILDDPIFLVVGFILTVAPPAIQLTQITQLNEFFEAEMAGVLFWCYVILALPMSILVVSGAISVLRWAEA
ncbi:AFR126Wp [Eremothecium gossypii ATCC 10895]|uniref:AFR126Wp n=1 Tax=Eremothecium gossypii (strain ATCC 10895 / CBS 109.51 / FGSC 9923 / NRRL Y-1056) TaxID=284811 RepID=Q754E4_EREGS|nr:AFR126Wp [Eremothecium gossypii ATCC 10895]AAS53497.1 AFR126Wp [Eremothecium gossypii ATCC 10895]AEY97809.1 FAFR126Wp [Eremothecium gossypii FDAG1]